MLVRDKHYNLLNQYVSYEKMKCCEYAPRAVGLGGELSLISWGLFQRRSLEGFLPFKPGPKPLKF
jgi:hypothetical protein